MAERTTLNYRYSNDSNTRTVLDNDSSTSSLLSSKDAASFDWSMMSSGTFQQKPPFDNLAIYSSSSTNRDVFKEKDLKPNLQRTLTEFTVAYLIEKPSDIIDYAVKHFTRLQQKRKRSTIKCSAEYKENKEIAPIDTNLEQEPSMIRRKSVFAEEYNPDDDLTSLPVVIPKTREQFARLKNSVKDNFVFRYLDDEQLQQVLDAMFERRVQRGEVVIRQNDEGDYFYVIESGAFDIIKDRERIFSYNNKGAFGEIALMHKIKRTATVQATTDGMLWAMDRQSFRRILLRYSYKKQKMYLDFLEKMPLLKSLGHWERLNLAEVLEPRYYKKGDFVIRQGDVADGMYFIEKGHVLVYVERKKGSINVNRLEPTQYFGELALLMPGRRHASIIAGSDVTLAFLNKDSFERMLGKCIDILNRQMEDYNLKDFTLKSYLAAVSSKFRESE